MTAAEEEDSIFHTSRSSIRSVRSNVEHSAHDIENAVARMSFERRESIAQLANTSKRSQSDWNAIKHLFESEKEHVTPEDLDKYKDLHKLVMIEEEEDSGMTLLRIALDNKTPSKVIQSDDTKSALYNVPVIDIIIGKLLEATEEDKENEQKWIDEETAQMWIDKHLAEPLLFFVTGDFSLGSDKIGAPRKTENKDQVHVPVQLHDHLARSVMKNTELQDVLNLHSWQRRVVAITLLDFYAIVATIVFFLKGSLECLEDIRQYQGWEIGDDEVAAGLHCSIALHVMICFFLLRECLQAHAQGVENYLLDAWNILDISKIVLLLTCAIWTEAGLSNDKTRLHPQDFNASSLNLLDSSGDLIFVYSEEFKENPYNDVRILLAVTGGVLFLSLIAFLRNTFLPFSTFVSGTANIMVTLIPFFIITIIVLLAFMFMYFVMRFDEGVTCNYDGWLNNSMQTNDTNIVAEVCTCEETDEGNNFCTYGESFMDVFGYLAGGPDDTVDILDIVCGFVVVIIFLNVVIAIVSNAWDEAADEKAYIDFWSNRISYFDEIRSISSALKAPQEIVNKCFPFTYIDNVGSKDLYASIRKAQNKNWQGRLKSDITVYWTFFLKYLLCFPLGAVTFGLFWPTNMLTFTGGVLFLSLVAFLRNTFLPFSTFVSGTANIMVTLIPFFIIAIVVLLAFMFMHFVMRFDEGVTCNYDGWLNNSMQTNDTNIVAEVCTPG